MLKLLALQWCRIVILACLTFFVQKRIPENHAHNWLWNSYLDFTAKKLAFKFNRIEPAGLLRLGHVSGLSQEPSETEDIAVSEGNAANDSLTQLMQGTIDRQS